MGASPGDGIMRKLRDGYVAIAVCVMGVASIALADRTEPAGMNEGFSFLVSTEAGRTVQMDQRVCRAKGPSTRHTSGRSDMETC